MDKTLGQIAAEADFGLPVSGDISNYERIAAAVVEEHERRKAAGTRPTVDKEKREELRRLHEAATKGEWELEIDEYEGEGDDVSGQILITGLNRVMHDPEWAEDSEWKQSLANSEFIAAAHNALPALLDALDAAEVEVEALKTWRIETKDKTDCWECDGTANTDNGLDCVTCAGTGLMMIYARDARQRAEGAAEAWDQIAAIGDSVTDKFIHVTAEYAREQAARLRREAE